MENKSKGRPRVLVVNMAFVGDVVLSTPLLKGLREKYPEAFIAFMGTPGAAGLLKGLPILDEIITYDKKGTERGIRHIRQKARQLKEMSFDMVVSPHRSARTSILLALAGIERRIGFASADLSWLYHQRVTRDEYKHEVLRNLSLLEPLGGIPPGFDPELILPETNPPDPEILGAGKGKFKVAISPGSEWRTKRWHPEGFARAGRILKQEQAAELYLLGMENDAAVAAEVEEFLKGEVINLTGRLSRESLNNTLAAMDLLITNDSAPAHIASAFKVPVVAVFGPTTPEQGFAPWQSRGRVAEVKGLPCRPCGKHGAARCPQGHFKCMELLRAEDVAAQAAELLREGSDIQ